MAAGKLVGIPVVDHIIVTKDSRRWHSMMARGTMPFEE
jgi:DNA repair protein RadC